MVSRKTVVDSALLLVFVFTIVSAMILLATPYPYEITVPWEPTQKITVPPEALILLLAIAALSIIVLSWRHRQT